jgi:rod shape-determining protein MreD
MRWLRAPLIVAVTVVAALALTVVPLPDWAEGLRPLWVALAVFYWVIALPERFGVGLAWIVGLLLDALTGTLLGAHALALTLVAFVAARMHLKLRMFPVWQQSIAVGLALSLYAFVLFWIGGLSGETTRPLVRFLPIATSVVLWPWIYALLRAVRRRFVPA